MRLDKRLTQPHNLTVKRKSILFAQLLTRAADRVYLTPVSLGDRLLQDASQTLHILSTKPETFGPLAPCDDPEARLERLNNLLTASRAYVASERKRTSLPFPQGELPL